VPYAGAAPCATRRTLEISTAVAVALVGAVVSLESLTHDIAWNEAGPGSGYFPFRVGLLLIGVAAVQLIRGRRLPPAAFAKAAAAREGGSHGIAAGGTGSASDESGANGPVAFVTREELGRSLSVFWPTAALVAAMFLLGSYIPSGIYLAWMLRRHGGRGWLPSIAYGAVVMAIFFLIFDVWFRVPLARGPW
jgi:hypothetical protein